MCLGCGDCVAACPQGALSMEPGRQVVYDWEKCVFCDACIQTCRHGSSPRIRLLNAQETYSLIKRQVPFIRGVTVSGGECMLYPEFLRELFVFCKASGLHTLIDSNGTIPFGAFPGLLEVTDGVMLDIKAYDPGDYRMVTGGDNRAVLENAVFLAESGKLYEIRTVVVPGLFHVFDTVKKSAALLAPYCGSGRPDIRYKLITYRENGVRACYRNWQPPSRDLMEQLARTAREEGMNDVIIV